MAIELQELIGRCDKHGEFKRRVMDILGHRYMASNCPACMDEDAAEEQRKRDESRAENTRRQWEAKIGRAGIPDRFIDRTLGSYLAKTEGQRRALAFAKRYADEFDAVAKTGRSAMFLGKPGTGKTHLAIGIALQIMTGSSRTSLFCTVMRAIRTVKDTWRKGAEQTEAAAIEALVFPDLLILDEVGVQFGSDAEKLLLFDVLNERYERRRPTLMISNLNAQEVAAYLGERVMDRMREDGGQVVVFDWASYRGVKQ